MFDAQNLKTKLETQSITDRRQCKLAEKGTNSWLLSYRVRQKLQKIRLQNFRKFALSSLTLCHTTARGHC